MHLFGRCSVKLSFLPQVSLKCSKLLKDCLLPWQELQPKFIFMSCRIESPPPGLIESPRDLSEALWFEEGFGGVHIFLHFQNCRLSGQNSLSAPLASKEFSLGQNRPNAQYLDSHQARHGVIGKSKHH